jgi:hypothetical protein
MREAVRSWSGETLVFRSATAVALLHALDDAFLNRQPGVPLGQHALAGALALVLGGAALVGFPRLRPVLAAAVSLVFGVLATGNGALHVIHVALDGPAASDLTGVAAFAAGIVLVLLAPAILFRHRGERERSARRRWTLRVLAAGGAILLAYALVFPLTVAVVQTHKFREPIGEPPSTAYEPVSFEAEDGLEMSGWYVPSENGAAVVVVHGGGGDRTGGLDHAALLARHGYGVLVYDSRGRGESEGSHNAFGWGWEKDVAGALDFLRAREDVHPDRIGGLGLSTGADVLLEVAPERRDLRAVVADGLTARSFDDYKALAGLDEGAPFFFTMLTGARVFSGSSPGEPLEDLAAQVSPTPLLLVSTGLGVQNELEFNRIYAEAARDPVELWELPDVRHTAAVRERPDEYEERVVGFFDDALLGRR